MIVHARATEHKVKAGATEHAELGYWRDYAKSNSEYPPVEIGSEAKSKFHVGHLSCRINRNA
jgi:hypothetical protein